MDGRVGMEGKEWGEIPFMSLTTVNITSEIFPRIPNQDLGEFVIVTCPERYSGDSMFFELCCHLSRKGLEAPPSPTFAGDNTQA